MARTPNDEPRMTRVPRSKEEAQAAYDRMSGWYDLLAAGSEENHVEAGLRKLKPAEGEGILEIGFGTGRALVRLARAVGRRGRVYGVDISAGMAQQARARLTQGQLEDEVGLILGDGGGLPLADGVVDGIFSSFTLELFDTPRIPAVLSECRRVLRGSGRLCIVSMARRGGEGLPVRIYEWVHDRLPRYVDCRPIPVVEVVEEAGFEVVDVEARSMWSLPVDVVLARRGT